MRLIDGAELYNIEKLLDTDVIRNSKEAIFILSQVLHDIQSMPTIALETLPEVIALKKQLAEVTAVKHGEWLGHYQSGQAVRSGAVSSCCDMWNERKTHFCPNCGADMRGDIHD